MKQILNISVNSPLFLLLFLSLFVFTISVHAIHAIAGEPVQLKPQIKPAQTEPLHPLPPPALDRPELPEYLPLNPDKNFTLPPVPKAHTQTPAGILFELKGVDFEGNTVFTDEELMKAAAPFLNRNVGMADLEELRHRLTIFYVNQGYVNSGALIKQGQKVDNGVVLYRILEGRLNGITLKGNEHLHPNYIKKRIWPDADMPFNTTLLQERFQMMLQNPLIDRMNGRILPGISPGEAFLDLDLIRSKSWGLSINADNHSSANLGSEGVTLGGFIRNITGFGDYLNVLLGKTEGSDEYSAAWSIPLNAGNTTLSLNYNYSENDIIEASLKSLNIESRLESAELTLEHPLYHTLQRDFSLGISLKAEETLTTLGGIPFSFTDGEDTDGKSRATVLRLIQSFQDRTAERALALRSVFSFGVDLFGPSIYSDGRADSRFVSWLGQIQYTRRINDKLGQIIFRGDTQIADDSLLSMEQISVGGAGSVRGYRENELVRDNGYILSLEWRIPVWESRNTPHDKAGLLQIAPFMDYGAAWNRDETAGDKFQKRTLHSIGMGLLWSSPKIDAETYYGHGIEDAEDRDEYNLQDDGIHFSLKYKL